MADLLVCICASGTYLFITCRYRLVSYTIYDLRSRTYAWIYARDCKARSKRTFSYSRQSHRRKKKEQTLEREYFFLSRDRNFIARISDIASNSLKSVIAGSFIWISTLPYERRENFAINGTAPVAWLFVHELFFSLGSIIPPLMPLLLLVFKRSCA